MHIGTQKQIVGNRREIHERVLRAQNPDELAAAYADWAESYDADLIGEMGYQAPVAAADLLHMHLGSQSIRILDAGCGTGLVGQELSRLGYRQLVGLDYSADMLEHARLKGVYRQLLQRDLTKPLDIEDNHFDAIICVGTFTLGHVGPNTLTELVRITQAGGLICFTVRDEAWTQDNYETTINALRDNQALETLEELLTPYIEEEGSSCHICLVRVI
jgi:predicted TPR repeat methyltransferase